LASIIIIYLKVSGNLSFGVRPLCWDRNRFLYRSV